VAESQPPRAAGTIYDLGYKHYEGVRHGRGYAFRTLAEQAFKTAFGVGRGDKARQLPLLVSMLVFMPAMIWVAIGGVTNRPDIINYAQHIQFASFFLALFAAGQAAEVLVGDRETGTISLYLSRSLHSRDYAFAKVVALGAAFFVLTFGPQITMLAGKVMLSETPWVAFKGEYGKIWPMALGTFIISFYMTAVGMALASFAAKRNVASALVIAWFLVLPAVQGLAFQILRGSENQKFTVLINPFLVLGGLMNWLYDVQERRGAPFNRAVARADLPGETYLWVMAGSAAVALAIVLYRYRKSSE
jgi:ABC-2 type transport system permease protein